MKTMMGLVGAALLFGSAAMAGDAITLKCPADSVQALAAGQDLVCMKGGKRVSGPMVMLYPSGKKMAEGQIEGAGNFRTGTWVLYSEQGTKTHVISFEKGDFHGQWIEFHPNGQKRKVVTYERGAMVGQPAEFDLSGKPVVTAAK